MQIKLVDNDIDFSDGRGFQMITGIDEVVQRLETRLKLFRGEWFLNAQAGIPYLTDIFGKPVDDQIVAAYIRKEIIETPGVEDILSFLYTIDGTTRLFNVTFTARILDDDDLVNVDFNTDISLGAT